MTDLSRNIPPQRLINLGNPAVRALLESPLHGVLDRALIVLHVVGRKTGRRYDIPVGYVDLDGELIVITEHFWRINTRGDVNLEVTLRGHRQSMHCVLDENPASVAATIHRVVERLGPKAAQRLTGLKAPDGHAPSLDQLEAAVRELNLATLALTPSTHGVRRLPGRRVADLP